NADQRVDVAVDDFLGSARSGAWDGYVMTFPNTHPRWSYARVEGDRVVGIAEKQPVSRHATVGLYYFRRGADFLRGAERMLLTHPSVSGEFYVAPVFNELILRSQRVGMFPIESSQMHGLGTPEEVERYESRLRHPAA